MRTFFKNTYLAFIFLILYTPITVLMIFSFNAGDSVRVWDHWSLDGYTNLFNQSELWESVSVTLIVAFISTFVAVIIGTFAALGLSKTRKLTRNLTLGITNIPLVNADIVTAVSLMLLFITLGFSFGIFTLTLAHISFNIPYVIITVLPKIRSINVSQLEASQDLGATPWYTLRKIVLPTIKPAIIAGAAIAFAMSFDDFLISYFTGGTASNVSTFIYSLKRIKPYVNAFSTIIIILVAIIVISWNAYTIAKKRIKTRNEQLMKGTYRDKKIIKIEKMLNKTYLQLNNFYPKPVKSKRKKSVYSNNFEVLKPEDIIIAQNRILKNPKLVNLIFKLEYKIDQELIKEQQIKLKIIDKKALKEERSKTRREKYSFLRWPWRMIMISTIIGSAFIGLGALYLKTNIYDLSIANWGEYISPEILKGFEDQYHVKVKYSTYDDNESLYAKLITTNYDMMVPSDYMIAKLAEENRLLKLDPAKISYNGINSYLQTAMQNYTFQDGDGNQSNLTDYSMPYFWGDVVLVVNKNTPNIINDLGITYDNVTKNDNADWDVLKKAAQQNKRIILSDDMHNLFMTALVQQHYQNKWGENKDIHGGAGTGKYNQEGNVFHDYVNAHSNKEIDDAKDWLQPIIDDKFTKLLSDNIIDELSNPTGWDVAMMYNGDVLSAIQNNPSAFSNYLVIRPAMGTNIWNDDMVIAKNSPHQDLAYKFMNYILKEKQQVALSSEFGYTSPLQSAIDNVSALNPGTIWAHVYKPNDGQMAEPIDPATHPQGYFNGLYRRNLDPYMQFKYTQLIAR